MTKCTTKGDLSPEEDIAIGLLCERIDRHLRQLAPHMREREGMVLLDLAQAAIATKQASKAEQIRKLQETISALQARTAEADKQEPITENYAWVDVRWNHAISMLTDSPPVGVKYTTIKCYPRPPISSPRELELLAVIEQMREALVQAEYAIKGREHTGFITKALALTPDLSAIKEHDALVLETAAQLCYDLETPEHLVGTKAGSTWEVASCDCGDAISRMADERRKS